MGVTSIWPKEAGFLPFFLSLLSWCFFMWQIITTTYRRVVTLKSGGLVREGPPKIPETFSIKQPWWVDFRWRSQGHIRLRETCRVFWQQSGGAANGGFGMEGVWVKEDCSQGLWFLSCRFFLMNHRQMIWEWKKTCLFWSQHSFFFLFENFTQKSKVCPFHCTHTRTHKMFWNKVLEGKGAIWVL